MKINIIRLIVLMYFLYGCSKKASYEIPQEYVKRNLTAKWELYKRLAGCKGESKINKKIIIADLAECDLEVKNISKKGDTVEFTYIYLKNGIEYKPINCEYIYCAGFIDTCSNVFYFRIDNYLMFNFNYDEFIRYKDRLNTFSKMTKKVFNIYIQSKKNTDLSFNKYLISHRDQINKWLLTEAKNRKIIN